MSETCHACNAPVSLEDIRTGRCFWCEAPRSQMPLPFVNGLDGLAARENGYTRAPSRYMRDNKETIDQIREALGDAGFIAFCEGCVIKYRSRAGAKGDVSGDLVKAAWYTEMAEHVRSGAPDPRRYRA